MSFIDNITASNHCSSNSFVGAFSVIGSAFSSVIYASPLSRAPTTHSRG